VSPSRPSFAPQFDVYPKESRRLPSLPTIHYPPTTFLRPLFSYSYELLFPQVLSFDNHPRCPGVWGSLRFISLLATRHFPKVWGLLAGSVSLCDSAYPLWIVSPFVSYSCGLFGILKKVNSFAIRQIQTLLAKHPGWGGLPIPNASRDRLSVSPAASSSVVSVPLWRIGSRPASFRRGRSGRRGWRRRGAARGPRRCSLCGGGRSAARRRSRGAAR
jgi:hypothetical protein